MKIIVSSNTSWHIYNFRLNLIKKFISLGHSVYIISSDDQYLSKFKNIGCKIFPLNINSYSKSPINDLIILIKYIFFFYKIKPNFFLSYTIKPNIYGSVAAKLFNIKVINNISGLGNAFINNNMVSIIVKILYKFSLYKTFKVFFQNSDDQDLFVKLKLVKKENSDLVPGSGINIDVFNNYRKFNKPNDDPIVFLFCGRLIKEKGLFEFLKSAEIIKKKYKNTSFKIAGEFQDQSYKTELDDLLKENIKKGLVHYLGFREDILSIINQCDCIILPSYREGISRVLLEASMLYVPIITTDVSGCRDVVQHNFSGYLCKPRSVENLIYYIEKFILLTKYQKNDFGKNAKKYVEINFDENIVINKYIQAMF